MGIETDILNAFREYAGLIKWEFRFSFKVHDFTSLGQLVTSSNRNDSPLRNWSLRSIRDLLSLLHPRVGEKVVLMEKHTNWLSHNKNSVLRNLILSSLIAVQKYRYISNGGAFLLLHILTRMISHFTWVADLSHSDRYKLKYQSNFNFHFFMANDVEHSFKCFPTLKDT